MDQFRPKQCVKSVRIWSYSGPHFPSFGLNNGEIRSISLYSVRMRGNADQDNSEYRHFLRSETSSNSVPTSDSTDQRIITLTIYITLEGENLLLKDVYGGKTTQTIPCVAFPELFCLSFNPNKTGLFEGRFFWGGQFEPPFIFQEVLI